MITPKIPLLKDGQILSVDVVNSIIKRTEYAGDLLKQYKLIAGNEMYVEPHYDGTRVSYLQPVGGGGTGSGGEQPTGELQEAFGSYGGENGASSTYIIGGQTIFFENIRTNNNGNFGSIYVANQGSKYVLQIWNSNSAKDDCFNIYLNGTLVGTILFDFNAATGAIYKTAGWTNTPVGNIVLDERTSVVVVARNLFRAFSTS